jgi:hypothetical protein
MSKASEGGCFGDRLEIRVLHTSEAKTMQTDPASGRYCVV